MNILDGLNASLLLPPLAVQQFFHAVIWLAVLSWLGVQCLPSYDRRWRWVICSTAALLVLLVWQSVLPALGMVFQTPSLMTLCACLAVAWSDIKGPSARLFGNYTDTRLSPWLWFAVVLVGWCLLGERESRARIIILLPTNHDTYLFFHKLKQRRCIYAC